MEHILQFGISIDDDTIKRDVERVATNRLASELKDEIKSTILCDKGWGGSGFTAKAEEIIRDVMSEYKDDIIERSVQMVVDVIKHSKKYREALTVIVEEAK